MKIYHKAGMIAVVALVLNIKNAAAQEPESRESVRKQFVSNSVPGAKYGPEKKSQDAKQEDKPKTYAKGDFKSTLDEGKSQPGGAARRSAKRTVNAAARTAQKPLPSEKPAEKKELPKVEAPKPPAQGEENKSN